MSDDDTRDLERAAEAGDPAALYKLRYGRCRRNECCAHAYGASVPPLPPGARECRAFTQDVRVETVEGSVGLIYDASRVYMAVVELRIMSTDLDGLYSAIDWVTQVFPRAYCPEDGYMPPKKTMADMLESPPESKGPGSAC